MKDRNEPQLGTKKQKAAATVMAVAMVGSALAAPVKQTAATPAKEKAVATTQGKFFCNSKVLTAAEWARHKQLSEKMEAAQKAVVETAKGMEFQYRPAGISLGELAEWVAQESKCCPFFEFHMDLEDLGNRLCLRLSGDEGVKAFIRREFKDAISNQQR